MTLCRLAVLTLLTLLAGGGARAADPRPNILIVLADDMGWSDASPYGGEIYTPSLAQLASQGTLFTNFHVAGYCAPTRSMLLTGTDNHVTGLGNMVELMSDNQRGQPGYEGALNGRVPTIATLLRQAGYHTYMSGKWHLGKTAATLPTAQGFEDAVGLLEGGADNFEAKSYTPGYKSVHYFDGDKPLVLPPDFYSTTFYADRMIADIDAHAGDGRPFFGYLAFQAVHQPLQAPADFIARYLATYAPGWSEIAQVRYQRQVERGLLPPGLTVQHPAVVPDWAALDPQAQRDNAKRMAVYAGMLEYMDLSIGRVLEHLAAKGMLDNTVVVFASDNGGEAAQLQPLFPDYYARNFDLSYAAMGLRGSYVEVGPGWAWASSTPFSNFKGSAAEGGTRAPLILRYPGHVRAGARATGFTHVTDIVPTLLDFAGVAPAATAGQTGRSMAAYLAGRADAVHPADQPIGYEAAGSAALFQGDAKLVRNAPPYGDMRWRLYDLAADPTEQRDLSAADPARAAALQAAYQAYAAQNGVIEVPPGYDVFRQGRANAEAK